MRHLNFYLMPLTESEIKEIIDLKERMLLRDLPEKSWKLLSWKINNAMEDYYFLIKENHSKGGTETIDMESHLKKAIEYWHNNLTESFGDTFIPPIENFTIKISNKEDPAFIISEELLQVMELDGSIYKLDKKHLAGDIETIMDEVNLCILNEDCTSKLLKGKVNG